MVYLQWKILIVLWINGQRHCQKWGGRHNSNFCNDWQGPAQQRGRKKDLRSYFGFARWRKKNLWLLFNANIFEYFRNFCSPLRRRWLWCLLTLVCWDYYQNKDGFFDKNSTLFTLQNMFCRSGPPPSKLWIGPWKLGWCNRQQNFLKIFRFWKHFEAKFVWSFRKCWYLLFFGD